MLLDASKEKGQNTEWLLTALGRSIQRCELEGHAYTSRCLQHLERRLTGPNGAHIQKMDEESMRVPFNDPLSLSLGTFERLLCDRQYSAIEGLFQREEIDPVEMRPLWRLLAKYGFASLLGKIPIHVEAVTNPELASKLLVLACQRTLPNMDVVHVLVEKFVRDVNATSKGLQQLARGSHWWQVEQGIPYLLSIGAQSPLRVTLRSPNMFAKEAAIALISGGADVHSVYNEDNGHSALDMAVAPMHPDVEVVELILSVGIPVTTTAAFVAIKNKAAPVLDLPLRSGANPNQRLDAASNEGTAEDWADDKGTGNPSAPQFHINRGRSQWYALHLAAAPYSINCEEEITQCCNMMAALLHAGADVYAVYRQPLRLPWEESDMFPGCANNKEMTDEECLEEDDNDESSEFDTKDDLWPYDEFNTEHVWSHDNDEMSQFDTEDEWSHENDKTSEFVADDAWPQRTQNYGLQCVLHGLLEGGRFVKAILSQPFSKTLNLEHRNPQGGTPLLSACRSALGADAPIDATLFDLDHDVHMGGHIYDPFTSQNPDLTILGSLLSLGASPVATDIYGKNALHNLLEAHDPIHRTLRAPKIQCSLHRLANEYPQLVNQPDNNGTYPLHSALQRLRRYTLLKMYFESHTEDFITLLLAAGADPAARDSKGNTALHYLADGLAEVVNGDEQRRLFQVFVDRGLDVNTQNGAGKTPLAVMLQDDGERAEYRNNFAEIVIRAGPKRSEEEIDAEVFGMFEKAGVRWDVRDNDGQSLLNVFPPYPRKRSALRWEFLVSKGLDPLARDGLDMTTLEVTDR